MTIVAIWNPASGHAPAEAELRAALDPRIDLIATSKDDPGRGQTARAVEAVASTVVVCGGDGTMRACLDPLAGTGTALDLVPLGTSNLLAANLGVPAGLEAAEGAGRGPIRTIDLGHVNGEAFAVMAGSGFDALMIRDADGEAKSRLGPAAYVLSALRHLREPLELTAIDVDGDPWFRGRSSMVLVGNFGTVSGGLTVFPDAEADDGLFEVGVLTAGTVREWIGIFARLLAGRPQSSDLVRMGRGRHVVVRTRRPRIYELDGEERPPTSTLEFTIDPGALRIHDRAALDG